MRVASRGDLLALIEAERPIASLAEAFAVLDRLALRTTGLRLPELLRRATPNRSAKAKAATQQKPRRTP
jgi:hypothetical protein